jgi:probable F420-dependent oxidoreductase
VRGQVPPPTEARAPENRAFTEEGSSLGQGISVGVFPPAQISQGPKEVLGEYLRSAEEAGLDYVCCGDHVSFWVGFGSDGLLTAASYAALTRRLPVAIGVYLLVLRHPVLVARQISTFESLFPGRLILGVGIGGEDRHEVEICGVDPSSRGHRMDECLEILRALMTGKPVSYSGRFFQMENALVLPNPKQQVPILVGGRSDAAVRRAARYGEGWLPIWVSAQRFRTATARIAELAEATGRDPSSMTHGLQVWCSVDSNRQRARERLAAAMEALYRIPFERFEKWCPYGDVAEVAEFLRPYAEAGCRFFHLTLQAADPDAQIEAAAEIKRALAG